MVLPASPSTDLHPSNNIRPQSTDHPDKVTENLFTTPSVESFIDAKGVAEVHRPREVLFGTVEPVCSEEFLGPKNR